MNVEYNGEEKILTISVAAYNVEEFLANTLNSCVVREVFNEIEVLIVDDGSTDHTADIAQEYINNYPDMFQLIRKQTVDMDQQLIRVYSLHGENISGCWMEMTGFFLKTCRNLF